ncbi:carboxymuconolactone decarboxylase family protein [Oceaniglobus roseus]|uniref:carboxymuconolactone decarboxylase family protein n=1 Tax=Oceaniglobus roseus TaxID=1737570 RepID=UPI000C7F07A2|nr:carboxymuconolactone decarboxylase family protein [Kandeliimicrobium roseum]
MTERPDYTELAADLTAEMMAFTRSLAKTSIPRRLRELVNVRVSQINRCAFCVDTHLKYALAAGEETARLHHLAIWRESPLFDAKEKAALAWAEALTVLGEEGVPDAVYDAVRAEWSEREMCELAFVVMAINGWNRASVAFRLVPGSKDEAWKLTAKL